MHTVNGLISPRPQPRREAWSVWRGVPQAKLRQRKGSLALCTLVSRLSGRFTLAFRLDCQAIVAVRPGGVALGSHMQANRHPIVSEIGDLGRLGLCAVVYQSYRGATVAI